MKAVGISILGAFLWSTSASHADKQADARANVRIAEAAEGSENWGVARTHYAEAFLQQPSFDTAIALARIDAKLELWAEAANYLHFALNDFPPTENRRDVVAELEQVSKRVGRLELQSEPEGATIKVGGNAVTTSTYFVSPGSQTISFELSGFESQTKTVDVMAGQTEVIRAVLAFSASGDDPNHQSENSKSTLPKLHELEPNPAKTWVLVGGGAATAIGAGFTIGFALNANANSSKVDELGSMAGNCTESETQVCRDLLAAADAQTLASKRAVVAGAITGGLLVATTVLYFTLPSSRLQVSAGWQSVQLSGNF